MNAKPRCWCFDVTCGFGKPHVCCQCDKCNKARRILHFDFNRARLTVPDYCFSSLTHSEIFDIHLNLITARSHAD